MRDLRKDMRQYIDLRRALGYKLRKHEPRLNEFITFLAAKGSDRITTRLAVAWATESSKGHKHSCFERLGVSPDTGPGRNRVFTQLVPASRSRNPTSALIPSRLVLPRELPVPGQENPDLNRRSARGGQQCCGRYRASGERLFAMA
jgi:integrase/recombinase XerD